MNKIVFVLLVLSLLGCNERQYVVGDVFKIDLRSATDKRNPFIEPESSLRQIEILEIKDGFARYKYINCCGDGEDSASLSFIDRFYYDEQ